MVATWYLDPGAGSDSQDGSTFAKRCLTLGHLSSLAAGDTVRVIGSPDPTDMGQTATFTNKSLSVTLTTAVTLNIANCDSAWTASSNVTCTASSTMKEGTHSASMAINGSFTTGLAAYFNTGTINLSPYQQVSFWIQANAAVAANLIRLRLSTTTGGGTATHDFPITRALNANQWTCFTFNNGSNMNSAIASVALVVDSTLAGATTFLIDNIIACKAVGSVDSLTLSSLISKNTTNEVWYAIKSINGTTVTIDDYSGQGQGRGYSGTTGSAEIWKRECITTPSVASNTTVINACTIIGTVSSPVSISGGWNTTDMSTQTLNCSIVDGQDGFGKAWCISGAYTTISNLGAVRTYKGLEVGTSGAAGNHLIGDNLIITAMANQPLTLLGASPCFVLGVTTPILIGPSQAGSILTNSPGGQFGTLVVCGSGSQALTFGGTTTEIRFNTFIGRNCGSWCLYWTASGNCRVTMNNCTLKDNSYGALANNVSAVWTAYNLTTSGNANSVIDGPGVGFRGYWTNASMGEATIISSPTAGQFVKITSHNEGGVSTAHKIRTTEGTIASSTGTLESPAAFSWKFSPTSTFITAAAPLTFTKPYKVYVAAGKTLTFTQRVQRDNTGITAQLRIPGAYVGVTTDVTAVAAASINTWETLTVSCTPTNNEWIEIWPEAFGGTTYNAYFGLCTASST